MEVGLTPPMHRLQAGRVDKVLRRAVYTIYGFGLIAAGLLCLRLLFATGSAVLLAFTFVFALAILAGLELLWKGAFGED